MRAVIFANGELRDPQAARRISQGAELIIAADGGAKHCQRLDIQPHAIIGDFDSLSPEEVETFESMGTEIHRYPRRKDFTDLELALNLAKDRGAQEVLVIAALGYRWDQTLANMLLTASSSLAAIDIRLLDGPQEILLIRSDSPRTLRGKLGDTVSLIPIGGHAHGITTEGLEYQLTDGSLNFGSTRGISNLMVAERAQVTLQEGLLICVLIHNETDPHIGKLN